MMGQYDNSIGRADTSGAQREQAPPKRPTPPKDPHGAVPKEQLPERLKRLRG